MSVVVCELVTDTEDLLFDYHVFVEGLRVSTQARYLRRRAALRFTERFSDLESWMQRTTPARLSDLDRTDAWPFVAWCFASGKVLADADLLGARAQGAHYATWALLHPSDVARAHEVASALSWERAWADQVCRLQLAFTSLTSGVGLKDLNEEILQSVAEDVRVAPSITTNHRRILLSRHRALVQVCFQLGLVASGPPHANLRPRTPAERARAIPQSAIRDVVARYLTTVATTLRPSSVRDKAENLELFFTWLHGEHPEIERVDDLTRPLVEEFLVWNHGRLSRGRRRRGEPVSVTRQHGAVSALRTFLDDLIAWQWADRPARPLVHASDLPKLLEHVPRALTPSVDAALMKGVSQLDDVAARCAITILRGTGMRLGELLELELDCLIDYSGRGTWLRVPVGKLSTERTVPLDEVTLAACEEWMTRRGAQRAVTHPRTGQPADLLFMIHGHAMGAGRIRRGLERAVELAGLTDPHGDALRITPHQLRHTYATSLLNGGMSLQALMALLGHVTPEMTLRYAHLASDTVRDAYDDAMTRVRRSRPVVVTEPADFPAPNRIGWLHAEMLKTRLTGGYCTRHLVAGPCSYANVCEQCDNFAPTDEFADVLATQLADVKILRDDATERGWDAEFTRHAQVVESLQNHLVRLKRKTP